MTISVHDPGLSDRVAQQRVDAGGATGGSSRSSAAITWATVIDAERPTALAGALGATPGEISAGLATAQLIAGFAAALIGIPAGSSSTRPPAAGPGRRVARPCSRCTREDIDEGMQLGCGHSMGPLTLSDFIRSGRAMRSAIRWMRSSRDPSTHLRHS